MPAPIPSLTLNTSAASKAEAKLQSTFQKNGMTINYGTQNTVPWYVVAAVAVAAFVLLKKQRG